MEITMNQAPSLRMEMECPICQVAFLVPSRDPNYSCECSNPDCNYKEKLKKPDQ